MRFIVMDVDGVLTDGRMVLSDRGDELKAFHTRDGIAIALARRAGLRTAMVTGETSPIAKARGDKLGVDAVILGARRKWDSVQELLARFELPPAAVAYIGDDLLDIAPLQHVGLAVAVADACAEVKAVAHAVTKAAGGHGAVREAVEMILKAQGTWEKTLHGYLAEHGAELKADRR